MSLVHTCLEIVVLSIVRTRACFSSLANVADCLLGVFSSPLADKQVRHYKNAQGLGTHLYIIEHPKTTHLHAVIFRAGPAYGLWPACLAYYPQPVQGAPSAYPQLESGWKASLHLSFILKLHMVRRVLATFSSTTTCYCLQCLPPSVRSCILSYPHTSVAPDVMQIALRRRLRLA